MNVVLCAYFRISWHNFNTERLSIRYSCLIINYTSPFAECEILKMYHRLKPSSWLKMKWVNIMGACELSIRYIQSWCFASISINKFIAGRQSCGISKMNASVKMQFSFVLHSKANFNVYTNRTYEFCKVKPLQ